MKKRKHVRIYKKDVRFHRYPDCDAGPSLQRYTAVLCDLLGPKNVSVKMFLALGKVVAPNGKQVANTLYQYRARYRDQMDDYGNVKYMEGDKEFVTKFIKGYNKLMKARKPVRILPLRIKPQRKIVIKKRVDKSK